MTIGNLPKDIRSKPSRGGQILLGYLPTTKLEHITNKAVRRRAQTNLYHACMWKILEPLEHAGLGGIEMTDGNGVTWRTHPIFVAHVSDYPEQVLVTCTKSGECPICLVPRDKLGDLDADYPLRNVEDILRVLEKVDKLSRAKYTKACKRVHIKPVYKPFWENLPYSDAFASITPDILHQLLQGVVKHLVAWLKEAYSEDEIDARCRRFPPNHNVRLFFKGISKLSKLTGREHADICRILLGLVVDMPLLEGNRASAIRLVRAVRALLDFVYLAQYPMHSNQTLDALDDALERFHAHKDVFIELGIRVDFNFPKIHGLRHYRRRIEYMGSADNYNTKFTERLHIDMAKEAYRATNKKDEYDQMTLWLERKEKILRFERYIKWYDSGQRAVQDLNPLHRHCETHVLMTREPSAKAVTFHRLEVEYGAKDFEERLSQFVIKQNNPAASLAQVENLANDLALGFAKVPVYHKAKFWETDFPRYRHASDEYDVIHATPAHRDKRGNVVSGRFDTGLVNLRSGGAIGVKGT